MDDVPAPAAGLDAVAHETRLEILRALAEHQTETPADRTVGFADLRRAVGMRDSGNFSYHLDELVGWLVERTDDGYHLSPRGMQVVSTLAAGAYGDDPSPEPLDLDRDCPACGEPLWAVHEDGGFSVRCEGDHALMDFTPAAVLRDRDPETVVAHFATQARRYLADAVAGTCPLCQGTLDRGDDDSIDVEAFLLVCRRCGLPLAVPPAGVAVAHPATTWFATEQGVDLRADAWAVLDPLFGESHERVAADEPLYAVDLRIGDGTLQVVVDDEPSVVELDPSPEGWP